ncbi:hypothetical protein [Mesorhizobium sp. CN2-181]|uniref:hypothetical protein n=1 Tax=Mesorhizobium yinganensis TaxID=3157707 RepID=UPI0032B78087
MDILSSSNCGRAAKRGRWRTPAHPARDPSNFHFRSSVGGNCQDDKFAAFHAVDYGPCVMFNQTKWNDASDQFF